MCVNSALLLSEFFFVKVSVLSQHCVIYKPLHHFVCEKKFMSEYLFVEKIVIDLG